MIFYKIGCYALIVTGLLHLVGHFQNPVPENDTERQLLELMSTYAVDVGNRSTVTMMGIQKGFSLWFSLALLWSGSMGLLVAYRLNNPSLLRTLAILNTVTLLVGTGISVIYFFFIPTACLSIALIFFVLAVVRIKT